MKSRLVSKLLFGFLTLIPTVVLAQTPAYDQCIYALNPTASNALSMSGSVNINAPGCGVVVNSSNSSALRLSGSSHLTAKYIKVKGGVSITGSATASPTPQTGVAASPDPLTFLVEPPVGACNFTNFTVSGSQTVTVGSGTYCNGITISGSSNVTF
jgi:hypothetical protein